MDDFSLLTVIEDYWNGAPVPWWMSLIVAVLQVAFLVLIVLGCVWFCSKVRHYGDTSSIYADDEENPQPPRLHEAIIGVLRDAVRNLIPSCCRARDENDQPIRMRNLRRRQNVLIPGSLVISNVSSV